MPVKAFSYFRFSSAPQAEGDSLRRQLSAALEWAAEHPEVELDTSLRDLGVSAYRGQNRINGALSSFLNRVEKGDIPKGSYFLIEGFDRLTRENESTAIHTLTGITLAGVKVVTLTDGAIYDETSDAMDLMRAIIVMSRAHEENKAKSKKLAAAWMDKKRRARETGEILSKRGPAWLAFNERTKRFDLIPERAAIVRRMFQDALDGLGTTAIASRFNEEGIEPFGRADGWHANYVLTILRGTACIGFYQPKNFVKGAARTARRTPDGDPIPNYFTPVVSDEIFYRVQSIIDDRNRRGKGRGRRGKTFPNLLIGLSRCEKCGGRLGIHNSGRSFGNKLTLSCNDAARKHRCTNRRKYDCRELESGLIDFLASARLKENEIAQGQPELQFNLDLIADKKRKIEFLLDQIEVGAHVGDRLRQRQAELVSLERETEKIKHIV
ncbi:MAG TPA: recombinase family protein, partial [Caulobacteraceae bacterium]|nr:recombinase family protein [Caulobacteraceae bacterium]